jgi:uracil-DNA glycosylase
MAAAGGDPCAAAAAGGAGASAASTADPENANWLLASIPPAWRSILAPYEENLKRLETALEARSLPVHPPRESIWAALSLVEPAACKVIILGQDPYPTAGNAHGLAFSYKGTGTLPASLKNIYKELAADIGTQAPTSGDLTGWAKQGVLLLNTILTVDEGKPLSHEKIGWAPITDAILAAAAAASKPAIILWGKSAQAKKKLLPAGCHIIESPHPSPLAAHTGFFGSKPFSAANKYLVESGRPAINWTDL